MARYGQAFEERTATRVLPPERSEVRVVAQSVGVSEATQERWRAKAIANGKQTGGRTAAARLEAAVTTASMSEEEKNAWCRAPGLFPSDLFEWRRAKSEALKQTSTGLKMPYGADGCCVRKVERELQRKEKAMTEAATPPVLSIKFEAIFHTDADE